MDYSIFTELADTWEASITGKELASRRETLRECADALRMIVDLKKPAIPTRGFSLDEGDIYRHKKRGTQYIYCGLAVFYQAGEAPIQEGFQVSLFLNNEGDGCAAFPFRLGVTGSIGEACLQDAAGLGIKSFTVLVIYRDFNGSELWARRKEEFDDGRFEKAHL